MTSTLKLRALGGHGLASVFFYLSAAACWAPSHDVTLVVQVQVPENSGVECVGLTAEWSGGSHELQRQARADNIEFILYRENRMPEVLQLQAIGFSTCDDLEVAIRGRTEEVAFPRVGSVIVQLTLGVDDQIDRPECRAAYGCLRDDCDEVACSEGGVCRSGICVGNASETQCSDGIDNDGDGLIDCVDLDCEGTSCDDGRSCTDSDQCSSGVCSGSTSCRTPPDSCHALEGQCNGVGDCEYPVAVGASCDPTDECRAGGLCLSDGTCAGQQPLHGTSCASGAGVCENGSCQVMRNFSFVPALVDPPSHELLQVNPALDVGCVATIDTSMSSHVICGSTIIGKEMASKMDGSSLHVIALRNLQVAPLGRLRATGPHPLVLLIYGDASIQGEIDVGSTTSESLQSILIWSGAGAGVNCAAETGGASARYAPSGVDQRLWAGGGGGGLGSGGADGAPLLWEPTNPSTRIVGGKGGSARSQSPALRFAGGCPGGSGGNMGGARSPGGAGGGAVALAVSGKLMLEGSLFAGGAGGIGGDATATPSLYEATGGGGGGAGGVIYLEAGELHVGASARLAANGGGGGQGGVAAYGVATLGASGQNGGRDSQPAAGGGAPHGLGRGGAGGTEQPPVPGHSGYWLSGISGGGGGGASGHIQLNVAGFCEVQPGAISSPLPAIGASACAF